MKAFFKELAQAFLCRVSHKRVVYAKVECSNIHFGEKWHIYHLRCTRCGAMKQSTFISLERRGTYDICPLQDRGIQ